MENLPAQLKERIAEDGIELEDGKYPNYVMLHSLDQESFNEYAEKIGVDTAEFTNPDTLTAIVIEQISYQDHATGKFIETKTIEAEVGDRIDLSTWSSTEPEDQEPEREMVGTVQIGALTDEVPTGVQPVVLGGINLIVPEGAIARLAGTDKENVTHLFISQ